jgi:hypothetical protein
VDATKSEAYKNMILKEFSQSVFAKIILDPEYSKHLDDADAGFTALYNGVYDLYVQRKYAEVITRANDLLTKYPDNRFAAQLFYLRTIAAGHQEKLAPFMTDLQQIVARYPDDKLVTPLATQHLTYIDSNKVEMETRTVVLTGNDVNDIPFTPPVAYQKQTEYRPEYHPSAAVALIPEVRKPITPPIAEKPKTTEPVKPPVSAVVVSRKDSVKTSVSTVVISRKDSIKTVVQLPKQQVAANTAPSVDSVRKLLDQFAAARQAQQQPPPANTPPVIAAAPVTYIFSLRDSTNYYFVVNVNTGTTNLASSRFGIGQFNRTRFSGSTIKHDLKAVGNDNQLIFVGRFYSLEEVKNYARSVIPLMPDIMKVPKDKYSFFIITRENLDKLANQKTLDSYIDYYQKYY